MFTKNNRERYDFESLWGIGSEFEIPENEQNDELALLENMILESGDVISSIDPLEKSEHSNKRLNIHSARDRYTYYPKFIELK